jgi:hypothetical protein
MASAAAIQMASSAFARNDTRTPENVRRLITKHLGNCMALQE